MVKRQVSLKALDYGKVEEATKGTVRQTVTLRMGITDDKAREIGKFIKGLGLKGVQHQIQGEQVRDHRQEAGRPADRDRGAEGERLRRPAAVHELPRLKRKDVSRSAEVCFDVELVAEHDAFRAYVELSDSGW